MKILGWITVRFVLFGYDEFHPLILPSNVLQCCVYALSVGCVARNPHPHGSWVSTVQPLSIQ